MPNLLSNNNLQALEVVDSSVATIDEEQSDHLIASIEQFKKDNYRYPKTIILNENMAQRYLLKYKQGASFYVKYRGKTIEFVVNIRMIAGNLLLM